MDMSDYVVQTTYFLLYFAVLARKLSLPVPAMLFLLFGGRWPIPASWALIQQRGSSR
jgi:hypothetical protein